MWHWLTTSFYFAILIDFTRTLWYALICQGLHYAPYYGNKVRTLFTVQFGTPNFSIICIGSKSCLWSIVGLPGSYAYYLTFRSIG